MAPLLRSRRSTANQRHEIPKTEFLWRHTPIQRTWYILLADIDAVKHQSSHEDYKYRDQSSILLSLSLLVQQYSLQDVPKAERVVRKVNPEALKSKLDYLLKPNRQGTYFSDPVEAVWCHGSLAVRDSYLEKLQKSYDSYTQRSGLPAAGVFPLVCLQSQVEKALAKLVSRPLSMGTSLDDSSSPSISQASPIGIDDDENDSASLSRQTSVLTEFEEAGPSSSSADHRSVHSKTQGEDAGQLQVLISPDHFEVSVEALRAGQDIATCSVARPTNSIESDASGSSQLVTSDEAQVHASLSHEHDLEVDPAAAVLFASWNVQECKRKASDTSLRSKSASTTTKKATRERIGNDIGSVSPTGDGSLAAARSILLDTPNGSTLGSISDISEYGHSHRSPASSENNVHYNADVHVEQTFVSRRSSTINFELNQLRTTVNDISRQSQDVVSKFFINIDSLDGSSMAPTSQLQALFRKCWGPDWHSEYAKLRSRHELSPGHCMRALISAFLHDRVLMDGHTLQSSMYQHVCYQAPAAQIMFGLLSSDLEHNKTARKSWDRLIADTIATRADSDRLITKIASSLGEELIEIIRPYIQHLTGVAESPSGSHNVHDDTSLIGLREELSKLLEAAFRLKIDLTRSDSGHTFIWPCNGEPLDTSRMKPLNRPIPDRQHRVAYTLFPSIQTEGLLGVRKVRHAEVVSVPDLFYQDTAPPVEMTSSL